MKITSITIENFKIYTKKEFVFEDNDVIILTGANGFGKTTLLDAIEWCFTGDIGREKKYYEIRNTSKTEQGRKDNNRGIIKNSNSSDKDIIRVTVELLVNGQKARVSREQEEDTLYDSESNLKIEARKDISDYIEKYINKEELYPYHYCDTSKSYDLLTSKREDIAERFQDFISPKEDIENRLGKLDQIGKILVQKIKDIEDRDNYDEVLKEKNKELNKLTELEFMQYPKVLFYDTEDINIYKKEIDKIKKQKVNLERFGYKIIEDKINKVILYQQAQEENLVLEKIYSQIEDKHDLIEESISYEYYKKETIKDIEEQIENIQTKKNRIKESKDIITLYSLLEEEEFKIYIDSIKELIDETKKIYKDFKKLEEEISERKEGSNILDVFLSIVSSRESILEYKNAGNEHCPLCGSDEIFKQIKEAEELGVRAQKYIDNNDEMIVNLNKKYLIIEKKIMDSKKDIEIRVLKALGEDKKTIEERLKKHNQVYRETEEFFNLLSKFEILPNTDYKDKLENKKVAIKSVMDKKDQINIEKKCIEDLLILLSHKDKLNMSDLRDLKKLKMDSKQRSGEGLKILNFNLDEFNKKLLSIESLISNRDFISKKKEIKKIKEQQKQEKNKIGKFEDLRNRVGKYKKDISDRKISLEVEELRRLEPFLYNIYKKIIRHTTIEEFKIVRDRAMGKGGIAIADQNKSNVLNILSEGQMGVFMLSFFLANMFRRDDETKFKTYFIDDVTNCMDDMNTLNFIDILKYQMYEEDGVINQLFFCTCDNDMKRLFTHKMKSFELNVKEFNFTSYGEYGEKVC